MKIDFRKLVSTTRSDSVLILEDWMRPVVTLTSVVLCGTVQASENLGNSGSP